jgi:hypothetical protein
MMGLLLGARPRTPHRAFPLLFQKKKGSTKLPFFHHKQSLCRRRTSFRQSAATVGLRFKDFLYIRHGSRSVSAAVIERW